MKPGEIWRETIEPHTVALVLQVIEVPIFSVDGHVDTTQHVNFFSVNGLTEVPIHWCYNFMERIDEAR